MRGDTSSNPGGSEFFRFVDEDHSSFLRTISVVAIWCEKRQVTALRHRLVGRCVKENILHTSWMEISGRKKSDVKFTFSGRSGVFYFLKGGTKSPA